MERSGLRIERYEVGEAVALLCEDPSLPMVEFGFALRHGAWGDDGAYGGETYLLFELMTRGTRKKTRLEFNNAMESLGSSITVSVTSELALFRCACLKRHFETTVELVLEMLCEPALDEKEFNFLVKECQQELKAQRDEDDALATLFFQAHVYPEHPLGRAPEGSLKTLGLLTLERLRTLHKERFHPGEQVWFFGGDFKAGSALGFVERAEKSLSGKRIDFALEAPKVHSTTQMLVVDKPERSQVQMRLGTPLVDGSHRDVDFIWLGILAFGGIFTSPFTREIRDIRGWSYFASASFLRNRRNITPLIFSTATGLEDTLDCIELQFKLYRNLVQVGLTCEVLEHARSYLLKRYPFDVANAGSLMVPALRNELIGKPENSLFTFSKRLRSLDIREVSPALHRNLPNELGAVVLVGPADFLVPGLERRFSKCEIRSVDYRDEV